MKTKAIAFFLLVLCAAAAFAAPLPGRVVLGGKAVVMVADAVYLFPSAKDRVVAVGGTDQGLGVFLGLVDPGFAAKPSLDRAAGAESYVALKPDLAVFKSAMKKSLGPALDAAGVRQLYLDLETPEDYLRELKVLGEALGEGARGEALAAYYRAGMDRVASTVSAIPRGERPRVLVLQASGGGWEVPPASWMQSILAERAGGEPVWRDANPGSGWAKVGPEQIAAWNPDAIFVINYREKAEASAAALRADPALASLRAAKAGRIHAFPQDFYSWDQPDSRWILGLSWMAKKLHPSRFADLSVAAEAERFYAFAYGLDKARYEGAVKPRLSGGLDD
ncbi:MAG TPA: ABC transporter substrate-binding protein [Spirochaetia bacterium]|nr:ABC transporter substrate-binding protein [Spirochaetales bacterium]HRY73382.1 ABC transporter substrate-binding protein [Spirochaetia bacterium]